MAVNINPQTLRGPWTSGFALDLHTTGSTFLGQDEFGHERFESGRTPLGDLLYRLKYRNDSTALEQIVNTAAQFLCATWRPQVDLIVPIPPSNTQRRRQPVSAVARALSIRSQVPFCEACLSKLRPTQPMKDQATAGTRQETLRSAFSADPSYIAARRVLLFDDLYRSGTTARAATHILLGQGSAHSVYLLALTRTRTLK